MPGSRRTQLRRNWKAAGLPGIAFVMKFWNVTTGVQNLGSNLHGGAIATVVDDAGTIAIMTADPDNRPGVTTDLNVSYFSAGKSGDAILIDASVLKTGRTMAYVSVDLRREKDGKLIAQGRMTKYLG